MRAFMSVSGTYCPPYFPNRPFPPISCHPCCDDESRDFFVILYSRSLFDTACDIYSVGPDLPYRVPDIFRGESPGEDDRHRRSLYNLFCKRPVEMAASAHALVHDHRIAVRRHSVTAPDHPEHPGSRHFSKDKRVRYLDRIRMDREDAPDIVHRSRVRDNDPGHKRPERAKDFPGLFLSNRAGRRRGEHNNTNCISPGQLREPCVFFAGDPADLYAHTNSSSFFPGSLWAMIADPIKNASQNGRISRTSSADRIPLSDTMSRPAARTFSERFRVVERSTVMVDRSRLLIPISCVRVVRALSTSAAVWTSTSGSRPAEYTASTNSGRRSLRTAAMRSTASAPSAFVSGIWRKSMTKSFRSTGTRTAFLTREMSAPAPPKKYGSVRTEIPTQPPSARTPAIIPISTFLRMIPPEGEAHLISAITGFFCSAERIAASRLAWQNPSGSRKVSGSCSTRFFVRLIISSKIMTHPALHG